MIDRKPKKVSRARALLVPLASLVVLSGQAGCDRRPESETRTSRAPSAVTTGQPRAAQLNALVPDVLSTDDRPPYRAGGVKIWEGAAVVTTSWSIHPGGSVQNRVLLARWESPAVGAPIEVMLVHDAAAAALSRAAGKGFRLGVGALLEPTATGVVIEEPDGTHRAFTELADGSFASDVFDTDELQKHGTTYVLRTGNDLRRTFERGHRACWREETRIDRVGDAVTIAYDDGDYPISIGDTAGRKATFARGADGRYETVTDPEGRVFRFVYTDEDLTELQAPAVSGVTPRLRFTFDAAHRIVSRSAWGDANGTSFVYDGAGRATEVVLPERYQGYKIEWTNASLQITDALGHAAKYGYAGGTLVSSADARGLVTTIRRDEQRRPVEVIDPLGHKTSFAYDAAHNLIAVTDASGRTTRATYDARHLPISVIDPLGGETTYTYGPHDMIASVTTPLRETTEWKRDAAGNLTQMVDFAGRVRMNATYDGRGHALTVTGPTGLTEKYTYDAYGAIATVEAPNGRTRRQTTSPMGAPLETVNGLGEVASFTYDPLGRLERATNPRGPMSFTYDLNGRMLSVTDATAPATRRMTTSFTADGRLATRTVDDMVLQAGPQQIAGVP